MSLKNILIFLIVLAIISSCKESNSEKGTFTNENDSIVNAINKESNRIFKSAILLIKDSGYEINIDSLENKYRVIKKDSAELALNYTKELKDYAFDLQFKRIDEEIKKDKIKQKRIDKQNQIWSRSKAGKIHKKHPEWSKEECERLADNKIWIGMTYEMLVYLRGKPDKSNPSNYGNGIEWQWCWYNRSPSCFYAKENKIVTAYN